MFYSTLFAKLQEKNVRYLVVGGLAINLHGVPRMTADIDLALALDAQNIDRFIAATKDLGLEPKAPVPVEALGDPAERDNWRREKHMIAFNLIDPNDPLLEVDVLLDSGDFDAAYARRRTVAVGDLRIDVMSVQDLIENKKSVGRKQDAADVEALEVLKQMLPEPDDA